MVGRSESTRCSFDERERGIAEREERLASREKEFKVKSLFPLNSDPRAKLL
jgi:hypothetical protein